jgi:excisionase family DNA binding protein
LDSTDAEVPLLSVKDAAKFLAVHPSLIYAQCTQGKLPHIKVGRYYKFKREDLLNWMNQPKELKVNIDEYVDRYLQKHILKG